MDVRLLMLDVGFYSILSSLTEGQEHQTKEAKSITAEITKTKFKNKITTQQEMAGSLFLFLRACVCFFLRPYS